MKMSIASTLYTIERKENAQREQRHNDNEMLIAIDAWEANRKTLSMCTYNRNRKEYVDG